MSCVSMRRVVIAISILVAQVLLAYPPARVVTFEQLLSQIEQSSPRLAKAKSELAAAKAEYTRSRAFENPELSFSEERLEYPAGDETERTVSISQDISFLWNAPMKTRSFSAKYEAALARFQEDRLSLLCDVLVKLRLRAALERQIDLTERISGQLSQLAGQVDAKVSLGDVSVFDGVRFRQSLIHFAGARASLLQAQSNTEQELMELTGLDIATLDKADASDRSIEMPFANTLEALDYASDHSFALRTAKLESVAATRNVAAHRWAMIPNVSLGVGRKEVGGGIDGPVVEAQIELPLFNQNRSELASAIAERNKADSYRALHKLKVEQQITQSWLQLEQIENDLGLFADHQSDESVTQAIRLYNFGEASALETVDFLQSLVESENTLTDLALRQQALVKEIVVAAGYDLFEE